MCLGFHHHCCGRYSVALYGSDITASNKTSQSANIASYLLEQLSFRLDWRPPSSTDNLVFSILSTANRKCKCFSCSQGHIGSNNDCRGRTRPAHVAQKDEDGKSAFCLGASNSERIRIVPMVLLLEEARGMTKGNKSIRQERHRYSCFRKNL